MSRRVVRLAIATVLASCGGEPTGVVGHDGAGSSAGPRMNAGPSTIEETAPTPPRGIGGSHTITAGGERIIAVPLAPTGIVVPEGVPVRVQVSGAITRTPTSGLQAFCALPRWKTSCETSWAEIVSGAPIGPSGFASAVPKVAMNGGSSAASPQAGSTVALETSGGGEVWFGRGAWGCYYVDAEHDLSGACHDFGGGWTVTVSANDGRSPRDPSDTSATGEDEDDGGGASGPLLFATLTSSVPTAGGAQATLEAIARNGTASNIRWLFIPDVVRTTNGDTTAYVEPATSARIVVGTEGTRVTPLTRLSRDRWRLPDGRIVGAGLHLVLHDVPSAEESVRRRPAGSRRAQGALTTAMSAPGTAVSLADCAESLLCEASVHAESGTFVVVAQVGDELLSAEARLRSVAPRATVELSCPGSVVRGSEAACKVKVVPAEAAATASLQVTGWSFTPAAEGVPPIGRIDRHTDVTSPVWAGVMAIGGTVTVRGTLDGVAFERSATIAVTARDWGSRTVRVEVENVGQGELPERPTAFKGQLGSNLPDFLWDLEAQEGIGSGPNQGVSYYKDMPVGLKFTVSVNVVALKEGSDFWALQPKTTRMIGGKKICGQDTFAHILALVYRHEGLSRTERNSHTQIFTDRFEKEMREDAALVEAMVGGGDVGGFLPIVDGWFADALAESAAMDNSPGNVVTNISMGCDDFLYRYPPGGSR